MAVFQLRWLGPAKLSGFESPEKAKASLLMR